MHIGPYNVTKHEVIILPISETMQAWLDCAPEWLLNGPEWLADFGYQFFKSFIYDMRWYQYVEGLGNTLLLNFMGQKKILPFFFLGFGPTRSTPSPNWMSTPTRSSVSF